MSTPNIITSDIYKLHIYLNTDLDPSGSIVYYILNNNTDNYINCVLNLFLSTTATGKIVNVKLEHYDNEEIKITENVSLTSSSAYLQKTLILYTQLLKISFISENFDGHIYGNISKTQVTTISTISTNTSLNVSFDKMNYDAFGRLRMSQPFTLFDSQNRYSKNENFTDISMNGANVLFNSTDSTIDLSVSNQSNSTAITESKVVFPYQPGKSLLIMNTFAFNDISGNNLLQRVGYYSNYGNATYNAPYNPKNGIFLEASGTSIYMCKANNSTVTKVLKSSWNNYTFSGESPYFINLDVTKAQIFWLDIEWLGVGSVRCGFVINGQFILAHTFHHANIESTTYMQTACLPIRYEIRNTTSGSGGNLKKICSTVISEGGYENTSIVTHGGWDNSFNVVPSNVSRTYVPLVSIRLKTGRFDSMVIPSQLSVLLSTADNLHLKFMLNGDISGTGIHIPYYRSVNNKSNVEYDISANVFSGGIEINSAYLYQNGTLNLSSRNDFHLQLGKSFDQSLTVYKSDVLTVVSSLVNASNSQYTISAILGWFDIIK
jgi:hypothetical protein